MISFQPKIKEYLFEIIQQSEIKGSEAGVVLRIMQKLSEGSESYDLTAEEITFIKNTINKSTFKGRFAPVIVQIMNDLDGKVIKSDTPPPPPEKGLKPAKNPPPTPPVKPEKE